MKFTESKQVNMHSAWRAHLKEFSDEFGLNLSQDEQSDNILDGLASFCREGGESYRTSHIVLLLARVLHSLGRKEEAQEVLRDSNEGSFEKWRDLLTADEMVVSIWKLVEKQLIHPAYWFSFSSDPVWVMDLGKLQIREELQHELIFLRGLRGIVEKISILWQAGEGGGVLGVQGLSSLGNSFKNKVNSQSGFFPDYTIHYIEGIFSKISRQNGWTSVPEVKILEL